MLESLLNFPKRIKLLEEINEQRRFIGIMEGNKLGKDINIYFTGYCEQDLVLLSDDLMTSLYRNLEHLDKKAQKVIHDNWPDKAVTELELRELILDKSGSYGEFALGYDAGVSPAGSLYLLVKFDKYFQADRELVYEIY